MITIRMKCISQLLVLLTVGLIQYQSFAQGVVPAPAPVQSSVLVIRGATAHVGNGQVIENSTLVISGGKILSITSGGAVPTQAEIIDATGKHVYPGFIVPNSTLGLREIDAVKASLDYGEIGLFNPNVRALQAYNAESRITPTVRDNGVLTAQIAPQGGLISGSSSVVQLDAWNWEDAVLKTDDGIYLNWPPLFTTSGWWAEPGQTEKNAAHLENYQKLEAFFTSAKAYRPNTNAKGTDQRFSAMQGLFNGSKRLFIRADGAREITEAVQFASRMGVINIVIVGAREAYLVTDLLKQYRISVILERLHDLPTRAEDDVKLLYKMPKLLQDAGILFCLSYQGDMEVMGSRNLAFLAGTAAAYGLTKEQALQTISMNTAKILGMDKQLGSLEAGKDATLFISTGDALDMLTNRVEVAYIQGRKIDLDNHQKQLYRKYRPR